MDQGWIHNLILAKKRRNYLRGRGILGKVTLKKKVFIEFVTILLLLLYVLVFWLRGMWDLNSPTQDGTRTPCAGRQSLNHWTTREVPHPWFIIIFKKIFWPQVMWDVSSTPGTETEPLMEAQRLNHWSTREVPTLGLELML